MKLQKKGLAFAAVLIFILASALPVLAAGSGADQVTSVGVTNGQPVSLTCNAWAASLEPLSYQWQASSSSDGPWSDLTATGSTLTITDTTSLLTGSYYRCVVTNQAAGAQTISPLYRLNVWNVANVPVISQAPVNQTIAWDPETSSVPGGEVVLTCSARTAQGADHAAMTPQWNGPDGRIYTAAGNQAAGTEPVVSVQAAPGADGGTVYTTTLTIPVTTVNQARSVSGEYSVTWFNNQGANEDSSDTEANLRSPAATDRLLAPQATSAPARVDIQVPGDPQIAATGDMTVVRAVGEQAVFSVTAVVSGGDGELVYVWQVTDNGGATWRNALPSDGTGQFTDTFTTVPLTQTMYDNSTASNVPGTGENGTTGNADTVYMYRVIVSDRATGAKVTSGVFRLIITQNPASPVLTPGSGSSITITGSGDGRYAMGLTVSREGTDVDGFLRALNMRVPDGCILRVVNSDGTVLAPDATVCTGCRLELVDGGTTADSATIIVMGDVLGTGVIGINQVVRMAQDLNGSRPLEGVFRLAGDFNGTGSVDIADLVHEAQILIG